MCQTPAEIDIKLIMETVQEYARRKGIFLKKKEAKDLASSFKNKYGRLPTFKEIWSLADKVVLQKTEGEDVSIEDKISAKMEKMKEVQLMKETRKKEITERRVEGVSPTPAARSPPTPTATRAPEPVPAPAPSAPTGLDLPKELSNLGFLELSDITQIINMIKSFPLERQIAVIERLQHIENEFIELENQGIKLSAAEKSAFRSVLVKLGSEKRVIKLKELVKDKVPFKTGVVKDKIPIQKPTLPSTAAPSAPSVSSRCGKCGAKNPKESNFCLECGAKLT